MTFTEWYKHTYNDEWHEDYAFLYSFASEKLDEYDEWCIRYEKDPIYDG